VLDFIDMEEKKNRQKLHQAVEQELRKDPLAVKASRCRTSGLIIITQAREAELERQLAARAVLLSGSGSDSSTARQSATMILRRISEVAGRPAGTAGCPGA